MVGPHPRPALNDFPKASEAVECGVTFLALPNDLEAPRFARGFAARIFETLTMLAPRYSLSRTCGLGAIRTGFSALSLFFDS